MFEDELPDILPGGVFIGIDPEEAFRVGFPLEQVFGIGNTRAVNECQADVIRHDKSLADPRAHVAAALSVKIGQSPAMHVHCGGGRNFSDEIVDLEQDIQTVSADILINLFNFTYGQHFSIMLPQSMR